MTEEVWIACTDPGPVMGLQRGGRSCERRCRLFACACVRRIRHLLRDAACGQAVEAAERFGDGAAGPAGPPAGNPGKRPGFPGGDLRGLSPSRWRISEARCPNGTALCVSFSQAL